jgi:hypothetical protein
VQREHAAGSEPRFEKPELRETLLGMLGAVEEHEFG